MNVLEKKIVNTKTKCKDFNLLDVIQQHFIITENYIYDQTCVRPIENLKEIEFYEDKCKSNERITIGLLRVCWDDYYGGYEIWYTLDSYTSKYKVTTTELKCIE